MTDLLALTAIVASLAIIVWLWHGDPKRRRVAGLAGAGQTPRKRRILAAGACVPGLALVFLGDSAAFLVWLGACVVGGWLVTQFCQGVRVRGGAVDRKAE